MAREAETLGVIGGAVDDHPTNPAFYTHANHVFELVNGKASKCPHEARGALWDAFLFLYVLVLDIDRKLMYLHRATKEHFFLSEKYGDESVDLLRLIAEHHEQIEASKPDLDEMVKTLERITHELWAGHQEDWHARMEAITGMTLTRHDPAETIEEAHRGRPGRPDGATSEQA